MDIHTEEKKPTISISYTKSIIIQWLSTKDTVNISMDYATQGLQLTDPVDVILAKWNNQNLNFNIEIDNLSELDKTDNKTMQADNAFWIKLNRISDLSTIIWPK